MVLSPVIPLSSYVYSNSNRMLIVTSLHLISMDSVNLRCHSAIVWCIFFGCCLLNTYSECPESLTAFAYIQYDLQGRSSTTTVLLYNLFSFGLRSRLWLGFLRHWLCSFGWMLEVIVLLKNESSPKSRVSFRLYQVFLWDFLQVFPVFCIHFIFY